MADRSAQIAAGRERLNKFRKANNRTGATTSPPQPLSAGSPQLEPGRPQLTSTSPSTPDPISFPSRNSLSADVRGGSPTVSSVAAEDSFTGAAVTSTTSSLSLTNVNTATNHNPQRREEVARLVQDKTGLLAEKERLDSQLSQALHENSLLHAEISSHGEQVRSTFEQDFNSLRNTLTERTRKVAELERARTDDAVKMERSSRQTEELMLKLKEQAEVILELEERVRAAERIRAQSQAPTAEESISPQAATSIANLQEDLSRKTDQLDTASFEIRRLTDALAEGETTTKSLQTSLAAEVAAREALSAEVERLSSSHVVLESKVAEADSIIDGMAKRSRELEGDLADRIQRTAALEIEIVHLAQDRDRERTELVRAMEQTREEQTQALKAENLALVRSLEDLRAHVGEVNAEKVTLTETIGKQEKRLKRLQQETEAFDLMNQELTRLRDLIRTMDKGRSRSGASPESTVALGNREALQRTSPVGQERQEWMERGTPPAEGKPPSVQPLEFSALEGKDTEGSPRTLHVDAAEPDVAEPATLQLSPPISTVPTTPADGEPTLSLQQVTASVSILDEPSLDVADISRGKLGHERAPINHSDFLDEIAGLRLELEMMRNEVRTLRHVKDQLQERLIKTEREKIDLEAKLEKVCI
ncbi:hypothetical protein M427DRAFT_30381 [Gonapodya prolifera JEL478]|uniref:Uncharacterized protein n=1 Tax=Gonapodya prolifera (strain JEL478) TaxID=1344416 RepID=A0A139ALB6_GONPJ|nr:hypothetical protein M427DRAFT_30381 [Gonapodya prolifera JEL478]|eukprot:KXS17579.1 hypothetical protein M427DRAFT_30381 [Gonapodya prolifera JEL478]